MMSFWVYDVIFLVLFSLWVIWFLRSRKRGLNRDGIVFMYRTQFGIKAIKYIGDNFKRTLNFLKYIIVGVGFILMGAMIWMLAQTVGIYLLHPEITKLIKAPPIAPLIPYFPKLFGMDSFFPPFYFAYFIVALAIVAIVHEFSHGIFMRLFKIKIKSTGIVFLGPILGAFVEQDDNSFKKKSKLQQMTVLAAGVFANLLFALIFYGLYVGFFFSSFIGSGVIIGDYATTAIPLENVTQSVTTENITEISTTNGTFYFYGQSGIKMGTNGMEYIYGYIKAPAIMNQMHGAIVQADNIKLKNQEDLRKFLQNKNPGDLVKFILEDENGQRNYTVKLGKHPLDNSVAFLGISSKIANPRGFIQKVLAKFMSFKNSSTYYKPTWDGKFVYFIYHLFWWIMIINLLVAIFNMMPLGMLDGGRFFYLTIFGIFKSEKVAKWAYKLVTYTILFLFLLLMFFWFIRII